MLKVRLIFLKLTVVALLVLLTSTANAEWKNRLQSQGNNIGMTISLTTGGPLDCAYYGLTPTQFPRGSGNLYTIGRWGWGGQVARDNDGNGTAEDTTANLSRAGYFGGERCSLEYGDQLAALAAAGENMEDASGRISVNRIWTSIDADDVADWPAEFREGRSSSGAPIIHGAETVVALMGDCFTSWGANNGLDMEHQFYFLNFAESNNMMYYRVLFRNMSEYNKWGPNTDFTSRYTNTPNGQVWMGFTMTYSWGNGFYIGGRDEAWADYFPRNIVAVADRNGVEGSFTSQPAMVANYPFALPEWNGQQMIWTNTCAHGWSTEFGTFEPQEVLEGGYPMNKAYRYGRGRYVLGGVPFYIDKGPNVNPWTGGPCYGWPGVPLPSETRYNQWWWGTGNASNSYSFFGEFTNFAPRDSFSIEGVIMFVLPKSRPFIFPSSLITEIDNPMVQDNLSPILNYADVATIVRGGNYVLPETPIPPALTIIPGDKEVTITWSDVNVNTPDAYYGFLQKNPSLDPNGVYRQYDFEGYRLYRSFVGPSDSHSALIYQCSISSSNLAFFYKDTQAKDDPLYRMENGMRVWYALVPYDRNYDPSDGHMFSLPLPASGKVWNRPGTQGTYNVQPRSEASDFRAPSLASIAYTASAGTAAGVTFTTIPGDGNADEPMLTGTPALIPPTATITFTPIIAEKITSAFSVYLKCTDWGPNGYRAGRRYIMMQDASGNLLDDPGTFIIARGGGSHGKNKLSFNGGLSNDGTTYNVLANFDETRTGQLHSQIDPGTYTGATVQVMAGQWGFGGEGKSYDGNGTWQAIIRSGQYKITWSTSGSDVTIDVQDAVRGKAIAFSPYIDEPDSWGIVPPGVDPYDFLPEFGVTWGGVDNTKAPQSDRSTLLVQKIAASNTDDFMICLDGQFFSLSGITAMPSAGTVMTVTTAYGDWNGDNTVFTQQPDPAFPGDSWKISVNPMTMDPKDADLSRVMVVPNPYMASSFLDLSPDSRRIEFVNLPDRCTIRIYSLGGHLVNVLNHIGANRHGWGNYSDLDRLDSFGNPKEFTGYDNHGGTEPWNLRNRFGTTVASGLYFFHVTDTRGKTYTGKFYVID